VLIELFVPTGLSNRRNAFSVMASSLSRSARSAAISSFVVRIASSMESISASP
jgi:hypothetical protein